MIFKLEYGHSYSGHQDIEVLPVFCFSCFRIHSNRELRWMRNWCPFHNYLFFIAWKFFTRWLRIANLRGDWSLGNKNKCPHWGGETQFCVWSSSSIFICILLFSCSLKFSSVWWALLWWELNQIILIIILNIKLSPHK